MFERKGTAGKSWGVDYVSIEAAMVEKYQGD